MSSHSGDLITRFAAESAIEPYKAGGIIDHVVSGPEVGMQEVVQGHLDRAALSSARGSTTPEQSTYMFNPERGLLISYSLRRNDRPDRSGLFAEIIELDEQGKPQYGISQADPFASSGGFYNVSVKENTYGFAPSFVEVKLAAEDQAPPAPPNIEIADLIAMQGSQTISELKTLEDFAKQKSTERENIRGRVEDAFNARYMVSEQAISPRTDANYNLIVSDRVDASALAAASRSVGIFPIVVSAMDIAERAKTLEEHNPRTHPHLNNGDEELSYQVFQDTLSQLVSYLPYRQEYQAARKLLKSVTPAFVTLDYEDDRPDTDEQRQRKIVIGNSGVKLDAWKVADSLLGSSSRSGNSPLKTEPVFSRVTNYRRGVGPNYFSGAEKLGHGVYEMGINPDNTDPYKAWLRKVRLDYMLTLYLRGINNL